VIDFPSRRRYRPELPHETSHFGLAFQQKTKSCKFLSKHNQQEKQLCLQNWD